MTTGAEFASITNKKLLGSQDFEERILRYLQTSIFQSVSRLFVEGSFSELVPLSSPGVDQVQVDLKTVLQDAIVHDGGGRILDLDQLSRIMQFENTAAQDYEVGARYIEVPSGVQINPSTGNPEYAKKLEGVGVEAEPTSVTDNGANITFRVDSLFEQGVAVGDHSGRQVRVFKKVPADGATTEGVAIETLTVSFGGGQNQITSAALFGQSVVSTTAADYYVQLVGPVVLKISATNRPSQQSDAWFCGVVTGNGGTPVAFDITGQMVIQSQSASGIQFVPFTDPTLGMDIVAADVQNAIEEVVADLATAAGSSYVGADDSSYYQQNPSASLHWGGIGPLASDHVEEALVGINKMLGRRSWGVTASGDRAVMEADQEDLDLLSTLLTGAHLLKGAADVDLDNIPTGMATTSLPSVRGESSGKSRVLINGYTGIFEMFGHWCDMQLGSKDVSGIVRLGDASSSFFGERLFLAENTFQLRGSGALSGTAGVHDRGQPTTLRDSIVGRPVTGASASQLSNAFESSNIGSGPKLIENVFFDQGNTGHTVVQSGGGTAGNAQPTTYSNCWFRCSRSGVSALVHTGSHVRYENCVFFKDVTTDETPCVEVTGGDNVVFDNCYMYSANGAVLLHNSGEASYVNSRFESANALSTGTNPEFVNALGAKFDNCNMKIGQSSARPSAASVPLVRMTDCRANGLYMSEIASGDLHNYTHAVFQDCPSLRDLRYNVPNQELANAMTTSESGTYAKPAILEFTGGGPNPDLRTQVSDLRVEGTINYPETQALANFSVVNMHAGVMARDVTLWLSRVNSSASIGLDGFLTVADQVEVNGLHIPTNLHQIKADFGFVHMLGDHVKVIDPKVTDSFSFAGVSPEEILFHMTGREQELRGFTGATSSGLDCDIVRISGKRCNVRNNDFVMSGGAATTRQFIVCDFSLNSTSQGHMVVNNTLAKRAGTNHDSDKWITFKQAESSPFGDECLVDGNILLNDQGTLPVIHNAASNAVTGDNVISSNSDVS